jgi:adenosylmethionine-8-amino-7-oxononanoate aminotransferase
MKNLKAIEQYVLEREFGRSYPVVDRGEGVYLIDSEGKQYLDGSGGPIVASIGHGIKEIADAIYEQAKKVCFAFISEFTSEAQINLANKIVEISPKGMSKVYFAMGGSEATEIAMKMVRQYHLSKGNSSRWKIVSRWQSYHGATVGALSMSGYTGRRADYLPYLLDFPKIVPCYCYRCPYGDTYPNCGVSCAFDLERVIKQEGSNSIAGFIAEPIGGNAIACATPPPEYYKIIREICDKYDVVMISDSVMTGFGRTGRNFGIDHWNVSPDLIATGKGITGGYAPLAAIIVHERLYDAFTHPVKGRSLKLGGSILGYTYSGNPLCCAAGVAVQNYIEKHQLIKRAEKIGRYLENKLSRLFEQPMVGDIRGRGCFFGIEFVKNKLKKTPFPKELGVSGAIEKVAFEKGLIILAGGGSVDGVAGDHIMIAPAFNISEANVDKLVDILEETIKEVQKKVF